MKTYSTGNETYEELVETRKELREQLADTRSPQERIRLTQIILSVQDEILEIVTQLK